jgi:hypothetical protein
MGILPQNLVPAGLLAYVIGRGIASVTALRGADELDMARWRRFWSGSILGFVAAVATVVFGLGERASPSGGDGNPWLFFILTFVGFPAAAGSLLGYLNMRINDGRDRARLASAARSLPVTPSKT